MGKIMKRRLTLLMVLTLMVSVTLGGCAKKAGAPVETITVVDQLGRTVNVPKNVTKVTGTHHFAGQVIFALGQQDKLVDQAVYGKLGQALGKVDANYAAKPNISSHATINPEELIALKPDVIFIYASSDKDIINQIENAGIRVVAVKGETFEEAFEAVKLISKVMNCEDKGNAYIAECQQILKMVNDRISTVPKENRPRVMFAGPKSVYTVASGDMLDTALLEMAGGVSVSKDLKGYWTEVSPEQVATWNPDIIILGSSLDTYGEDKIYKNPQFQTVNAIKNKKVYSMPSNIGWWDFPAPNCVLGVVWMGKAFYPDKFADVDMTKMADDFYTKYMGHSFTAMGGKL
ncbi:MAG: ABC transporter substrate-binding protein [Syntrophomonadaceae bacterium]